MYPERKAYLVSLERAVVIGTEGYIVQYQHGGRGRAGGCSQVAVYLPEAHHLLVPLQQLEATLPGILAERRGSGNGSGSGSIDAADVEHGLWLVQMSSANYYHWIAECLARLVLFLSNR
jgi:hypothetical protein